MSADPLSLVNLQNNLTTKKLSLPRIRLEVASGRAHPSQLTGLIAQIGFLENQIAEILAKKTQIPIVIEAPPETFFDDENMIIQTPIETIPLQQAPIETIPQQQKPITLKQILIIGGALLLLA